MSEPAPTAVIVGFLREIGLEVRFAPVRPDSVLPGIDVDGGSLVVDEPALLHPGDLLHEAGHLAVLSPGRRREACGRFDAGGRRDTLDGQEMAAIAWSYAAALHLGVDPAVVFHPAGYRGSSRAIVENFGAGRYFGVPILGWLGMTAAYPVMFDWLNRRTDAWPGDEDHPDEPTGGGTQERLDPSAI